MRRRHEKPIPRTNPSGKKVWVARFTNRTGQRKSAGTFDLKGPCRSGDEAEIKAGACCAQHAIDAAYEREDRRPVRRDTVGAYFDGVKADDQWIAKPWLDRHPRTERTRRSYEGRVRSVLEVKVDGVPFRDWPMHDIRRRHAVDIMEALLVEQGRAATGATGVLRVLSAMWMDAITDELAEENAFYKVTVRASDPRVRKAPKTISTWTWDQMHALASKASQVRSAEIRAKVTTIYEEVGDPDEVGDDIVELPMGGRFRATGESTDASTEDPTEMDQWRSVYAESQVRMLSDCGLRLGEMLPVERTDLVAAGACSKKLGGRPCPVTVEHVHIERTAWEGRIFAGTKNDHGRPAPGRVAPIPPTLWTLLMGLPPRIDTRLLVPTPRGKLWRERNWRRDVWDPAADALGMSATPHEFRHSWVSLLAADDVDRADLAAIAGHTVETATAHYTHSLGRSFQAVRAAIG